MVLALDQEKKIQETQKEGIMTNCAVLLMTEKDALGQLVMLLTASGFRKLCSKGN
jgi:hypothetical protein